MKLAVFGGTGFLGYDFVKSCIDSVDLELTIYSTSPKSMVNIARHDVDVQLISPAEFDDLDLPEDTDFIINFSHPFGFRDELLPKQQLNNFIAFVERQKKRIPSLRMIHLSTMSVYEPFSGSEAYCETDTLSPPASDAYATDKVYVESKLLAMEHSAQWQLHLRPTIVYGPFCRPWTDRIFESLKSGDVPFIDLSGKIQPIYGGDITRLIMQSLGDFLPGIYNMAGDETLTWKEFLSIFAEIVPDSKFVYTPNALPTDQGASVGVIKFYVQNLKAMFKLVVKDPTFDRMVGPIALRLPRSFVVWARDNVFMGATKTGIKTPVVSFLASPFFSKDRLVSMTSFKTNFKEFKFTSLSQSKNQLAKYYNYRFTDEILK